MTEWLAEYERWLLNTASMLIAALLLFRLSWYGSDWVSVAACIAAVVIMIVTFCVAFEAHHRDEKRNSRIARTALLALLLSSWCAVGGSTSGYWVNATSGETTATRSWLLTPPWRQSVYWVPQDFSQKVSVILTTRDGVPLQCEVATSGILLDKRVPREQLERDFLALAANGSPAARISSALVGLLADTSAGVLKARTSEEIYRQGQFLIPYQIGTPLGNMMSRFSLRWSKGEVGFKCGIPFES